MSAYPTPQADGNSGGDAGVSPASQQANPLQQTLAQLAQTCEKLASQNPVLQGEFMEARTAFIKGLQKTMMAARPEQPQGQPQQ